MSSNLDQMRNILAELIDAFPEQTPIIDTSKNQIFKEQVLQLAEYLKENFDLGQESVCVAVSSDNPSYWAATIALATLGIPSVGLPQKQKAGKFASHTLVLDVLAENFPDFEKITLEPNPNFEPLVPKDTNRIMLTSGTTGRPKAVVFTEQLVRTRLARIHTYWSDELVEIDLMGVNVTGGFFTALKALEQKRTAFLPSTVSAFEVHYYSQKGVRVVAGSPIQLRDFLTICEQNNSAYEDLKLIRVAGGALPKQLHRKLREKFNVPIRVVYGATETGGVFSYESSTESDANMVGKLIEDCQAEVSKDGELLVKTPDLAHNYLQSPATDSDGWFHTGDSAEVDSEGNWRITPRGENLVNIGGPKVNLIDVDNSAQSNPGVSDAACFPYLDADGLQKLALAVVGNHQFEWKALDAQLRREYGNSSPQTIIKVDSIPRAASGKAQRSQLAQQNPI